jgi:uncharacterized protein YaiI (UPF0178 family)
VRIFVDADAFPRALQAILFRAVERVRVPLIMVAGGSVRVPQSEYISSLSVPAGADAADDRIVELLESGDLVVTADIPLADRVVEKGGFALDPRGRLHTARNIKDRLSMRNLMEDLRGAGMITGGPAPFNQKNIQVFTDQLDRFLTRHCRK